MPWVVMHMIYYNLILFSNAKIFLWKSGCDMAGLKIGFYDNDLGIRGTALAMYRYAKYNEQILGNESHIFTGFYGRDMTTKPAFEAAFPGRVTPYHSIYPIDDLG